MYLYMQGSSFTGCILQLCAVPRAHVPAVEANALPIHVFCGIVRNGSRAHRVSQSEGSDFCGARPSLGKFTGTPHEVYVAFSISKACVEKGFCKQYSFNTSVISCLLIDRGIVAFLNHSVVILNWLSQIAVLFF